MRMEYDTSLLSCEEGAAMVKHVDMLTFQHARLLCYKPQVTADS